MRAHSRLVWILAAVALTPALAAAQSTESASGSSSSSFTRSVDLDAGDVFAAIALGAGGRDERIVRGEAAFEAFNNDFLVGVDAVGVHLRRTDTADSNLERSRVFGGDHEGTNFEDSRIRRADIRDAVIEDSTVWRGTIEDSNVTGSELTRVRVEDSHLEDTTVTRSTLLDVTLGPGVFLGRGVRVCDVLVESTGELLDDDC